MTTFIFCCFFSFFLSLTQDSYFKTETTIIPREVWELKNFNILHKLKFKSVQLKFYFALLIGYYEIRMLIVYTYEFHIAVIKIREIIPEILLNRDAIIY